MPNLPPALVAFLASAATFLALAVLVELAKRRGVDPVGRVAGALDRALPTMPTVTAGGAS